MKLYAVALISDSARIINILSWSVLAVNEYEAIGKSIERAKEIWPPSDGYEHHNVSVVQIPDDVIVDAYLSLKGKS